MEVLAYTKGECLCMEESNVLKICSKALNDFPSVSHSSLLNFYLFFVNLVNLEIKKQPGATSNRNPMLPFNSHLHIIHSQTKS